MQSSVSSPFSLLFLYFLKAGLWNNVKEGIFVSSSKLSQLICIIVLLHGYFGNGILGHPALQQRLLWKHLFSAEVVANCCRPDMAVESLFILYFSRWRLIAHNSLFIVVFIQCFQTNLLCNKMLLKIDHSNEQNRICTPNLSTKKDDTACGVCLLLSQLSDFMYSLFIYSTVFA